MSQQLSQAEINALFASVGPAPEAQAKADPRPAAFPSLERPAVEAAHNPASIGLLANVELEVTVHLGQTKRPIRDILSMGPGSVLELDRLAGESVDILVNGRLVARGEIVVIGENFGVRIAELIGIPGGRSK